MTTLERLELKAQGFEVLRPMYDPRKDMWKIMKVTSVGGWSRFGGSWYYDKIETESAIDTIVANYPSQYVSDNFKQV